MSASRSSDEKCFIISWELVHKVESYSVNMLSGVSTEQQTVRGGRGEVQLISSDYRPDSCRRTRHVKWAGNG